VELHAIKAPGWLQIFRFQLEVKSRLGQNVLFYGALRSDERYGESKILVFDTAGERDQQLTEWSAGLIVRRTRKR
jgi:hypothetical protein